MFFNGHWLDSWQDTSPTESHLFDFLKGIDLATSLFLSVLWPVNIFTVLYIRKNHGMWPTIICIYGVTLFHLYTFPQACQGSEICDPLFSLHPKFCGTSVSLPITHMLIQGCKVLPDFNDPWGSFRPEKVFHFSGSLFKSIFCHFPLDLSIHVNYFSFPSTFFSTLKKTPHKILCSWLTCLGVCLCSVCYPSLPLYPFHDLHFWVIFCKKIPLSRRVGYVMGGSVSGSVREVCHTNQIGFTVNSQSNLLS